MHATNAMRTAAITIPPGQPERRGGRSDRTVHGAFELGGQRIQVDLVSQPFGECVDGELGVVAATVEAPIDGTLDRPTDGLEQGERD